MAVYDFKVSKCVGNTWVVSGEHQVSAESVGVSVAKFYKWFSGWKLPDTKYRFNAASGGAEVWQWSHVPEWDD